MEEGKDDLVHNIHPQSMWVGKGGRRREVMGELQLFGVYRNRASARLVEKEREEKA
jgi:hypothetical protein